MGTPREVTAIPVDDHEVVRSVDALTPREREVAELLVRGHTNAEAAALLSISTRTVESHRASIYRRLRVRTRAELVRALSGHGHP